MLAGTPDLYGFTPGQTLSHYSSRHRLFVPLNNLSVSKHIACQSDKLARRTTCCARASMSLFTRGWRVPVAHRFFPLLLTSWLPANGRKFATRCRAVAAL